MSDEVQNTQNVGAFDDGKEVSSLGPPAIETVGGVPNEAPDLQPRVVTNQEAVEAFYQNDPDPGLQGDYWDSCCVCLRGTDTALAFQGEAEWLVAGLMQFGIPVREAEATVSIYFGYAVGEVPDGILTMPVRVCSACVSKAKPNFPAPVVVMQDAQIPVIGQPFKHDFPELDKADTVALMETVAEARLILQSGQCALCGVGIVDDPADLDMEDGEGRLICIRCSESPPCPECGAPMIDDDSGWLS